ncbi:MAG TPA: GNAT family N-acetyltransferase [Burkholderiales bacterium]|nr:GNAT family N-acetyltransferase [Burkholderiales bacterium]
MKITLCTSGDFDDIHAIINDAASAYRGVIPADRWHEPYMPREALEREIAAGVSFYGFVEQGKLVAVMGLQDVQDVALIRHAYTRTALRGRGAGAALLEHLKARSTRPLLVGTWKAATWAVAFYQKRGFVLTSEAEKEQLLKRYWTVPERQIEESVVLRRVGDRPQ